MKVKILRCHDPRMWYNSCIGEEFDIYRLEAEEGLIWCHSLPPLRSINFVYEEDGEVINEL